MTAAEASTLRLRQLSLLLGARISEYRRIAAKVVPWTLTHLLFLGGMAAVAYGCWMIWPPLGFIAGGWFAMRAAMLAVKE